MLNLLIAFWSVCGVVTYGLVLADMQRGCPQLSYESRGQDVLLALFQGALGPIGLFVSYFMSNFAEHGLLYQPLPYEVYESAHRRRWPSLTPKPRRS